MLGLINYTLLPDPGTWKSDPRPLSAISQLSRGGCGQRPLSCMRTTTKCYMYLHVAAYSQGIYTVGLYVWWVCMAALATLALGTPTLTSMTVEVDRLQYGVVSNVYWGFLPILPPVANLPRHAYRPTVIQLFHTWAPTYRYIGYVGSQVGGGARRAFSSFHDI